MVAYGRDDVEWDELATAGREFLIEQARARRSTNYADLNAELVARTGRRGFDFERVADRAAVGHLLGLIVRRDVAETGLMLSALVRYRTANDAGTGFYTLATELDLLPPNASAQAKERFWVAQVNGLFAYYAGH